ncbi:RHS repeat-associated core domain-containing protein [Flavisolibacter tropicus]|uniref:Teneurin-like YD-shell domain-containing protein n=1 Tax=Flavisolibacter tropicus TaxID=1492898 RepID=A0A172TWX3_9BACT|nr:RHS repeat-associated core domain-containing protein [Flavisolibacter tropicus]ANE51374.1 hypothetical protein SY85_13520 [Flavisolibacter tropicus]
MEDYKPIGGTGASAFGINYGSQGSDVAGKPLYNGNISTTTLALSKFRGGDPVGYSYGYDQLNRLKEMRQHNLTAATTTWGSASAGEPYKESYSYDANGNILSLLRNGTTQAGKPLQMDQLTYNYLPNTNKLAYVADAIGDNNYTEDIDNQAVGNYRYDKIGNLIGDVKEGLTDIQWSVYGKIRSITKAGGSTISYSYDAAGNRIAKSVTTGGVTTTTYYIRDAQGNTLAVYEGTAKKEQYLYGSSRLGVYDPALDQRSYELTNHLGNVLAVVSEHKVTTASGNEADVLSQQDYYPFGMEMPEGKWGNSYRYGFNGKEKDGETDTQDYGMRIYNPALGRFLSVDPITKNYPMLTPYQFASNSPISGVDLDGLEYYYAADGNFIAKSRDNNTQVRVIQSKDVATAWQLLRRKEGATVVDLNKISIDVGISNAELNTRAFLSTLKQTENHGNDPLPYNAMHGFIKGKLKTFTDKSYEEAPEEYKNHPYEGKKGGTAAGAYQLLRPTFNAQKKSNPLVKDFGPNGQDYAVLGILNTPGIDALEPIKAGDLNTAIKRLIKDKWGNTQFASLPGGGQEASDMTMDKLKELFKKNVSNELNGKSNISLPKGETLPK